MSRPQENRIELKDRFQASLYSMLSAGTMIVPEKLNFTVNTNDPNYVRRRWWYTRRPDNFIPPAQWLTYERDEEAASILPKNFKLSAITKIEREIMDRHVESFGGSAVPAIAYKLGTATMAGYSLNEDIFGIDPDNDAYYQVAMGVGSGPLIMSAGAVVFYGHRKSYEPLREGLIRGPVVAKSNLPDFMPNP